MKVFDLNAPFAGKSADFLMAGSVTRTCEIEGITQAGIPGMIHLTPTLDAEFISSGAVFSLGEIAETPKGVPTPGLITRAAQMLAPFSQLKILDIGMAVKPQSCDLKDFAISVSERIDEGAGIDAKLLFEKGRAYGKSYRPKGEVVILGESTPSGTTTAYAAVKALGYDVDGAFSSSFKSAPTDLKKTVVDRAVALTEIYKTPFEKVGSAGDSMLIFTAGFALEASRRFPLVLAGGTQMAAALLVMDRLAEADGLGVDASQLYLCTTQWVAKDSNSDIEKLLSMLSFPIEAFYSDFTFELSSHPALRLYDEGEAKEGVGAGAALAYMMGHGISKEAITKQVEAFLG